MNDVTKILERLNSGRDAHAAEELLSVVYRELRDMAQTEMNRERPGHTLQPTVLVHDAWLKLFPEGSSPQFASRAYFFAAASNAMRRILVDHARRRDALKRGHRTELSETQVAEIAHPAPDDLMLAVDSALDHFAKLYPDTASLVELRFFVGMTLQEAADALGIPKRTAERDYAYFTAWFRREFAKDMRT